MKFSPQLPLATVRDVRWNTVWLLSGRLTGQLALFLLTIFIARFLGERGLGAYALITTLVFVGNVFSTFGLDTFLIRQIARQEAIRTAALAPALLIQLALALFYLGVVRIFPPPLLAANSLANALLFAILSLLPLAFATVYSAALRAYEQMLPASATTAGSGLVQAIAVYLHLRAGGGLPGVALIMLAAQAAAAGMLGWWCRRLLPDFTINWQLAHSRQLLSLLQQGLPLALLMGLGVLYQRLGVLLLSQLADTAVLGQYAAAARLVDGVRLLPYAFFGALFPMMARTQQEGLLPRRYTALFPALLGLLLLAVALLWLSAPWLMAWLFGPDYPAAVTALRILSLALLPFLFSLRFSMEWVAAGYERRLAGATLGALLLTASAGWVMFIRFGLNGLCLALVAGEGGQALILTLFHPRRLFYALSPDA